MWSLVYQPLLADQLVLFGINAGFGGHSQLVEGSMRLVLTIETSWLRRFPFVPWTKRSRAPSSRRGATDRVATTAQFAQTVKLGRLQ